MVGTKSKARKKKVRRFRKIKERSLGTHFIIEENPEVNGEVRVKPYLVRSMDRMVLGTRNKRGLSYLNSEQLDIRVDSFTSEDNLCLLLDYLDRHNIRYQKF